PFTSHEQRPPAILCSRLDRSGSGLSSCRLCGGRLSVLRDDGPDQAGGKKHGQGGRGCEDERFAEQNHVRISQWLRPAVGPVNSVRLDSSLSCENRVPAQPCELSRVPRSRVVARAPRCSRATQELWT